MGGPGPRLTPLEFFLLPRRLLFPDRMADFFRPTYFGERSSAGCRGELAQIKRGEPRGDSPRGGRGHPFRRIQVEKGGGGGCVSDVFPDFLLGECGVGAEGREKGAGRVGEDFCC